jgi:hypothetical protein
MTSRLGWCATLTAVFSLGTVTCTGGGSSSSSSGGGVCDPGDRQLCPCLGGGGGGVQDCRDDGKGWQACQGCGGSSSSSGGSVCAPGATQACLCPSGGGQGVQTCMSSGAGWQPCLGCGGSSSSSSSGGHDPQQGDVCDPTVVGGYCTGTTTALLCDRNRLEPFHCRGPYGCSPSVGCDQSKAASGEPCLSTWNNAASCSVYDQRVMLLCQNGVWTDYGSCGSQVCVVTQTTAGCQ